MNSQLSLSSLSLSFHLFHICVFLTLSSFLYFSLILYTSPYFYLPLSLLLSLSLSVSLSLSEERGESIRVNRGCEWPSISALHLPPVVTSHTHKHKCAPTLSPAPRTHTVIYTHPKTNAHARTLTKHLRTHQTHSHTQK